MKSFISSPAQCLHKIIRLARHQKCVEKAMICAQNCQYKQPHLLKGDHPTILLQQFLQQIENKRAQIKKQGQKYISVIQKQYEQSLRLLQKKKQECIQNILSLIKTSGYTDKYLSGLQKVQNKRYQRLLCKQVYDLLKFQPLLTKKTIQSFQRSVREFQNCKIKNMMSDKSLNAEYEQKNSEFLNKKNFKQQKMTQKQKQKYQIIRQNPRVNAPAYLLLEDKLFFQELISKNQQLQIQLRKAQNNLKQVNKNKKIQTNKYSRQVVSSNSQSQSVVQIQKKETMSQHNNYVMRAIQKYIQKKGQQQKSNNSKQKLKQMPKLQVNNNQKNNIVPKINISPVKQNKQPIKQKQTKQVLSEQNKKIQIQSKNIPTLFDSGLKPSVNIKKTQNEQKKDEKPSYTLQGLANKKTDANIARKDQNIVRKDQNKMINQVNKTNNEKEIIKQEYNESEEIYKYYDQQAKNKQKLYTKTEQLKSAGNSIQNVIKLQLTYPIPSFNQKFVLKQIPKLDYSRQKITKLNYASKFTNNNKEYLIPKINIENQKEKLNQTNTQNIQNKNNINQATSTPTFNSQIKNQNQSKVISFLNAPAGTFKAPPSMLLNDPTIKPSKVDISKVFQMQQQMKKIKLQKKLQEQKIRKQVQEKQKNELQQQKKKKEMQQKKKLQIQIAKQKVNEQIIQSLMKSNDFGNNQITPNGQAQQIPKLKSVQLQNNKIKESFGVAGEQMKVQQQRQESQMDIQSQNTDSFQI